MIVGVTRLPVSLIITTSTNSSSLLCLVIQCSRKQGAGLFLLSLPHRHSHQESMLYYLPRQGIWPTFSIPAVVEGQGRLFSSGLQLWHLTNSDHRANFPHPCHHMAYEGGARCCSPALTSIGLADPCLSPIPLCCSSMCYS